MLHKLIKDNPDLFRLFEEKYEIQIKGANYVFIHSVPYLKADRSIDKATLAAKLILANDKTATPDHVVYFTGDQPCDIDGNVITAIKHDDVDQDFAGIKVRRNFSGNPSRGASTGNYADYHEMFTRYIDIISAPAKAMDPSVDARTGNFIESDDVESVFVYPDTNTTKAEIELISSRLQGLKIGIIGLGGTGSYVLDFISKTHVKEIHLFDEDCFLNHNAFRAPGAAHKDALGTKPKKVHYLHSEYSKMHKGVVPHDHHINESTANALEGLDFVFVCVDNASAKQVIFPKLLEQKIPFIDTGIDVLDIDDALTGCVRTTMVTPNKSDHVPRRISLAQEGDGLYDQNIQIAELNALNAALAVIKWKKFYGFYHDLEKEHDTSYETSINKLFNNDCTA